MTGSNDDDDAVGGRRGDHAVEQMAFVDLALRARGVDVGERAMARVRRMLEGSLTLEEARREIAVEYGIELPSDRPRRG